jgi:hypothetical protein
MSQLTITTPGTSRRTRVRPMRSERMVGLRSAMPLGLVTLRHDIPEYLNETTPKVDPAERAERSAAETPARKGA